MKIIVGVNTLSSVEQVVYSNHCQFWYRQGKKHPDWEFILNHPRRMSIDRMRNMTAKIALENNCDYLMFIDDDVIIPLDAIDRLLECHADIACGATVIRGYPFNNMLFKFDEGGKNLKYYNDLPKEERFVQCDAVGFSCVLISVPLLRKVAQPYFVTGAYNTEDVYFCLKALDTVPECRIICDTKLETGHMLGSEVVEPANKELFKKFYEDCFKNAETPPGEGDRAEQYLQMVKGL